MSNSPPMSPKEKLIHDMRKQMLTMSVKYDQAQERISTLEAMMAKTITPLPTNQSLQAESALLPPIHTRPGPSNEHGTPRSHEGSSYHSSQQASPKHQEIANCRSEMLEWLNYF